MWKIIKKVFRFELVVINNGKTDNEKVVLLPNSVMELGTETLRFCSVNLR